MELSYRGVSYSYNPPQVVTASGKVGGKYRGLDWRFRNLEKAPIIQPTANLKYRGVTFQVGQGNPATVEAKPALQPVLSIQEKARALFIKHQRAIGNRQQTLLSRASAEIGVSVDAAEHWTRIQGKIHPSFRLAYDRSNATIS